MANCRLKFALGVAHKSLRLWEHILYFEKNSDLLEQFNLPTAVGSPEKNSQIIPPSRQLSPHTQKHVDLAWKMPYKLKSEATALKNLWRGGAEFASATEKSNLKNSALTQAIQHTYTGHQHKIRIAFSSSSNVTKRCYTLDRFKNIL